MSNQYLEICTMTLLPKVIVGSRFDLHRWRMYSTQMRLIEHGIIHHVY